MASTSHDIERLNNFLLPACRLSSSLTTLSNGLYLITCLQYKGRPIKDNLKAFIDGDLEKIRENNLVLARSSSTAALAALLYEGRSILRLLRTIPELAKLYHLLTSPHKDKRSWWSRVIEHGLFTTYHGMENVATLVDYRILPQSWLERLGDGSPTAIYTLAYRLWMLGITLRALRLLGAFNQYLRENTAPQLPVVGVGPVLSACYLPIGWTLSGWIEHEIPGWHMILHYIGDGIGEARHHSKSWSRTKVQEGNN
ncbi:hypothetical protein KCU95_g2013, partial [Aureobasidium melanogenum]